MHWFVRSTFRWLLFHYRMKNKDLLFAFPQWKWTISKKVTGFCYNCSTMLVHYQDFWKKKYLWCTQKVACLCKAFTLLLYHWRPMIPIKQGKYAIYVPLEAAGRHAHPTPTVVRKKVKLCFSGHRLAKCCECGHFEIYFFYRRGSSTLRWVKKRNTIYKLLIFPRKK